MPLDFFKNFLQCNSRRTARCKKPGLKIFINKIVIKSAAQHGVSDFRSFPALVRGPATDPTVSRDPAALPERNGKGGVGHFPPLFWARGRSPKFLASPQAMGNAPSSGRRGNADDKPPQKPPDPNARNGGSGSHVFHRILEILAESSLRLSGCPGIAPADFSTHLGDAQTSRDTWRCLLVHPDFISSRKR